MAKKFDQFFVDHFGRLWKRKYVNDDGDYEDYIFDGYSDNMWPKEKWNFQRYDSIEWQDYEEIDFGQAERIKRRFIDDIFNREL